MHVNIAKISLKPRIHQASSNFCCKMLETPRIRKLECGAKISTASNWGLKQSRNMMMPAVLTIWHPGPKHNGSE